MQKGDKMMADVDALHKMYRAMDRYFRNDWKLPPEMAGKQWTYKSVDTSPHNALNTATKVLSAEKPKIKILPAGPDPDDKAKANKMERGLLWELLKANKRARSRIVPDVSRSALRYDRVCIQVIHLPHHYDSIEAAVNESSSSDEVKMQKLSDLAITRKAALRLGNYAINVRNPQNVFTNHTPMGLEAVMLVQVMTGKEIFDTWGEKASFLVTDDVEWQSQKWNLVDYSDHVHRMVWVVAEQASSVVDESKILIQGRHGLPFIPWVDRVGGTGLDDEAEYQCKPFLESIYRSKSWEATNVIRTLGLSEVIKYAGAPRSKSKTSHGGGVKVQYGGDGSQINLKTGEEWDPIPPPAIDTALMQWFDRFKNELNAQTSVQVLADLNFPAGTAYATINAVLQTAIASLQPYKMLAEMALADMFEIMLWWVDFTGVPIQSFGLSKGDEGTHYDITKEDFSVESLYLTVELNASAPTDRTERINAGVMLYKNLPVAAEEVLSDIGYADPLKVMRDRSMEEMVNNETSLQIQQRQQEAQLQMQAQALPIQMQMQQAQMQMQMQMQQMQMQMQAQAQQGMQGPGGQQQPSGEQGVPPGAEGADAEFFAAAEGQGYNQAEGGISTNQLAPGATRETLSGADARGQAIAEAR
jgi:hypothetical protein